MRIKNKRGSILAEALVAVSALVAGVLAVSTILNNAVAATAVSKDYLVAENLLNEAVNSINIIIDTNLMKWPQFKDQCWLVKNPSANIIPGVDGAGCQAHWPVSQTNYLAKGNTGNWNLSPSNAGSNLDLNGILNAQAPYRLFLKKLGVAPNTYTEYLHDPSGTASKFYRSVYAVNVQPNSAEFEITVQWLDGSKVREVKRNRVFNNES